ncbi:MAG: DUF2188 domain-containing protein [Dehalococcoidia bacterium]|nr:DUF2188 domain-containing protein [Dehalococcoidia bacterium]
MSNQVQTVYLKIPPDAARRLWANASPRLRGLLFGFKTPVSLHFIPAEGGCVIAAVGEVQQVTGRLSLLSRHRVAMLHQHLQDFALSSKALGSSALRKAQGFRIKRLELQGLRTDFRSKDPLPAWNVYEILPADKGWQVAAQGNVAAAPQVFPKKDEALKWARTHAKQDLPSQLRVRRRDGQIQTEFTYGRDPRQVPG